MASLILNERYVIDEGKVTIEFDDHCLEDVALYSNE